MVKRQTTNSETQPNTDLSDITRITHLVPVSWCDINRVQTEVSRLDFGVRVVAERPTDATASL